MEIQKFIVGIDVSKDQFIVCIKELSLISSVKIKGSRKFSSTPIGFSEFESWILKRSKCIDTLSFVMEATGVYYENLAYFLYEKGYKVHVVLPNKVKHYAKSCNLKTKTDKVDASMIAQMGIERKFPLWRPMSTAYKTLRDLCRERLSLLKEVNRSGNQLHAMKYAHNKLAFVMEMKVQQLDFYRKMIGEIENEINRLIDADLYLKSKIENISRIKGLQRLTIISIICETNGFILFDNIKQVISYTGLDIVMNESGNFTGRTRISKKGNSHIRHCLYMPAISAAIHNPTLKPFYERIVERNPKIKMKGIVATMRKLLVQIYILWKYDREYDPNYNWDKRKLKMAK